jgi:hypothetical protein
MISVKMISGDEISGEVTLRLKIMPLPSKGLQIPGRNFA